ncbi:AccI family restriction endonuclease [Chloracidobacterium validum]|uniref:AccI family restriction endonuclease n=1 Tax=Chloracidobacterium validum TaxID=2821543 RepID=A0ABX8BDK1_9BACT|nr:AccI family restriction endonuclease [Chloracidobacterium validum]QUW03150.1 AccI family restriction endonuclease [Chloracidobacterium validum]
MPNVLATLHPFERSLSVSMEDISMTLQSISSIPWADFLLNPRRLRGSDFLMRWSQGVWSEKLLTQSVNATGRYFALPYGPSGTAPANDVQAFEQYFEQLEKAGLGRVKRPDLLIYRVEEKGNVESAVERLGGISKLPFTPEDNKNMKNLLATAVIAVECENSLWRAKQMPDYCSELKPQKRLNQRLGLKKTAVVPTIIIKNEDRKPLGDWQMNTNIPIHIWHAFFDKAYGISFDKANRLINEGSIEPTKQVFQAPGGAITEKIIYKIYHHYAYPLGKTVEEPTLVAKSITDKNGHILPYVHFEGGKFELSNEALQVLEISQRQHETNLPPEASEG